MTALQMATINTAEYFGVSRNMGMIAPGRYADILLVEDLQDFHAGMVFCRGELIAENGEVLVEMPPFEYPAWACGSVHLPKPIRAEDFRLPLPEGADRENLTANVIGVIESQAPTRHLKLKVTANRDEIKPDPARDLAKISLVERHKSTGRVQTALVQGFGFTGKCAVATTVAHDCHHMIVVGTDEENMALAVNTLAECGGGQVVVKDGRVIGKVELPIAGLMSNEPARDVAKKAAGVLRGFRDCGCTAGQSQYAAQPARAGGYTGSAHLRPRVGGCHPLFVHPCHRVDHIEETCRNRRKQKAKKNIPFKRLQTDLAVVIAGIEPGGNCPRNQSWH